MKPTLRVLTTLLLVFAPLAVSAQPYMAPADGFGVTWKLDPREHPDVFTHTPHWGARSVLTGMDFDGDGHKEFLFTTDESIVPGGPDPGVLDVYLFENTGDDTYEHVWHYTMPDSTNSLPALAWGDIDQDGLWEIYFGVPTLPEGGNGPASDLFVFEQNQDGTFPDAPTTSWGYDRDVAADFRPAAMLLDDVDGDGQIELVTTSRTSGARELVVASPLAGIDAFTTWNIEFEAGNDLLGGGAIYDVGIVDYDNDGLKEIWVPTWNLLSMTVFEATGPDTYVLQVDINEATPGIDHGLFGSHAMPFVDFDGDGRLELPYVSTEGYLLYLDDIDDVANLTGDMFVVVDSFYVDDPAALLGGVRGADVGDLDGDGLWDVVVSGGIGEVVLRYEYDGVGDPTDSASYEKSVLLDLGWNVANDGVQDVGDRTYALRITDDLDEDGNNEVVIANLWGHEPGSSMILIVEAGEGVVSTEGTALPEGFVLEANYPNPFNPSTTFAFELPTADDVRVVVYDINGRLVRTLMSGSTLAAGRHEVTWDGRDAAGRVAASGTYFYGLEIDGRRIVRAMQLVK